VAGRLRRLLGEETRAVAAFQTATRADLELALALAGWFVDARDGVLETADQGFLLGGAWHAVPDDEETPDAEG
jgi:hypothetical protein